jgi:anhydro-N-acetylmuramic acid kinase
LGGFSNISFEQDGKRIAFDISPVNTVLNFYANQLGLDYDDRGKIAQSGNLNTALFDALDNLDFYQKPFPKSLGFEYVKEVVLPLMEAYTITTKDKMYTFVEHVALQIASALPLKKGKLLVTGGGAYNDFLVERINHFLPEVNIAIPEPKILEYKEALIFGLLGVLKLRNETNVLSSVTGAKKDHCSGLVYYFKGYEVL